MGFENELEALAGIKIGAVLEGGDIPLYNQLRDLRSRIALEIIPPSLRDEFTATVFPDRNLKLYAQALNKNRALHSKAVSDVLTAHMRASLIAGGYSQKLEQRGVKPADVLAKMVGGM